MNHLLITKFDELDLILKTFFANNLNRKDNPQNHENFNADVFILAKKIYKRGFISESIDNSCEHKFGEFFYYNENEFLLFIHSLLNEKIYFVIDQNVFKNFSGLTKILSNSSYFVFEASEKNKNLENVRNIMNSIPNGCKKMIAIGGGILLDLAGFISGLLQSEIYYVPTTLLAAIDAGLGGKTGVNFFPFGKNLVGLFKEAEAYIYAPYFFHTLSSPQILCGLVEALKHAWIFGEINNDIKLIHKIYKNNYSFDELKLLIEKNIQYKTQVVQNDFYETKDIRSALNLGHTFAHVLEVLSEENIINPLPHGIAVAHGINFLISNNLLTIHKFVPEFESLLAEIINDYPVKKIKTVSTHFLKTILSQDKKNDDKEMCNLSLPNYGHFKLGNVINNAIPVTYKHSLDNIVKCFENYIK